jgi:hypothetical protein
MQRFHGCEGPRLPHSGIKRFSLVDYFSRSRGYCGLLSSICHDYNYLSNDELRLRSILPYHDTTYLCLSWASITYTYDDIYTRVGRHHEGGLRAGTQVLEEAKEAIGR